MNCIGQISVLAPPLFFAPPPKRTITSEGHDTLETISATEKDYTPTSFPTKLSDAPTKRELENAFLTRFLKTLDVNESEVTATWPASKTANRDLLVATMTKATKMKTDLSNAILSVGGPSSSKRWLSRVVIGEVLLHDYYAQMFKYQKSDTNRQRRQSER